MNSRLSTHGKDLGNSLGRSNIGKSHGNNYNDNKKQKAKTTTFYKLL